MEKRRPRTSDDSHNIYPTIASTDHLQRQIARYIDTVSYPIPNMAKLLSELSSNPEGTRKIKITCAKIKLTLLRHIIEMGQNFINFLSSVDVHDIDCIGENGYQKIIYGI